MAKKTKPQKKEAVTSGAQSIRRATKILRLVARQSQAGVRMSELAALTGLSYPTVHRMINCLEEERLILRKTDTSRFVIGPLAHELGLVAHQEAGSLLPYRKSLARLAEATGDTVYLMMRSNLDVVCLDRTEGSFPIKALTVNIGERRPLGSGGAGLALLAALDDAKVNQIIAENEIEFGEAYFGYSNRKELLRSIQETRDIGFGLRKDQPETGMSGIGIAIERKLGPPIFGISIGTITTRLQGRFSQLKTLLRDEVKRLQKEVE
jgi:DNA-binding IclR family transcriptional regulator